MDTVPAAGFVLLLLSIGVIWVCPRISEELPFLVIGLSGLIGLILRLVLSPWPVKLLALILLSSLD